MHAIVSTQYTFRHNRTTNHTVFLLDHMLQYKQQVFRIASFRYEKSI